MNVTGISELMNLRNWIVYKLQKVDGKMKKIPLNPFTGSKADITNPETWGSIYDADTAHRNGMGDGLGFVFDGSGYAGIDLDNVINADGTIKSFALEIVNLMNSYTEYSQSGKGLHIIFKLKNTRLQEGYSKRKDNLGLEMYDYGRYFVVTGNPFGEIRPIEYRDNEAHEVQKRFLAKEQANTTPVVSQSLSDSEILQKMQNSTNWVKIKPLWEGDISGYNSQSEADAALLAHLAYWCDKDTSQMDSLFRQSGLMRDKWNRADYREKTIQVALQGIPDYVPEIKQPIPEPEIISDTQYLNLNFESDIKDFQRYSQRVTGFENLDNKLILYPGFYGLGAISSLGKTTLCLQLADNLAERGEHVLFFSFEQTRFELVSKSLARMAQPDNGFYDSIPTAPQIRNGRISPEIRGAIEKFKIISEHKYIIECDFKTDIKFIENTVKGYINKYGVKPVVFIDYLQLIRSDNPKLTNTKDIVDSNVRALKLLQRNNDLVMFVISSLNRQNYLTEIDFESFKESGAIEYTADVVIGLQLAVMNTKLFEADSKTGLKRKVVKEAKKQTPRYIEFCILKNRYGVSSESFYFEYYSKWDKFIPTTLEVIKQVTKELVNKNSDDEKKMK